MAIISAAGMVFTFNDGTTAQVIGQVDGFDFTGEAPERVVSTFASTNVERKLGLPDFGSLTLEAYWDDDDAGQAAIIAAQALNATREVVITFPNGTVKTFPATPKPLPISAGQDEDIRTTIVLTVAGTVVTT